MGLPKRPRDGDRIRRTRKGTGRLADCHVLERRDLPTISAEALHATFVEGRPSGPVTVASFTDSSPGTPDQYSVTIDWGDGSPRSVVVPTPTAGVDSVVGDHTYPHPGFFPVTATIEHTGQGVAGFAQVSIRDPVADAPLQVQGRQLQLAANRAIVDLPVASFTDEAPGGLPSDYRATVDWGDGETSVGTIAPDGDAGDRFLVRATKPTPYAGTGGRAITVSVSAGGPDFQPAGTWASVAPIPTPRNGLAATTGPDGRIYALGGATAGFTPSAAAEVYTPSTNTWARIASLPATRAEPAAATGPDGRIYLIGGYTPDGRGIGVPTTSVFAYDPTTDAWSTVASLPLPLSDLAAASGPDGRIYTIGGYTPGSASPPTFAYTPSTNTWAAVAYLPEFAVDLGAATGPDGRIYAFGGQQDAQYLRAAYALSPGSDAWVRIPDLPVQNAFLAGATGPDGRIDAIGGNDRVDAIASVSAYTPGATAWVAAAGLPTALDYLAATTGLDGRIYAISGAGYSGLPDATVEAYQAIPPGAATAVSTAEVSAPTLSGTGLAIAPTQGAPFSGVVATFRDPGTLAPADLAATIAWGDGTTGPGVVTGAAGQYAVGGTHTYGSHGRFVVTTTLQEVALTAAEGRSTGLATVAPSDVLAGSPRGIASIAGTRFSGVVASFTDTNPSRTAGDFAATIAWGDGTTGPGVITPGRAFAVSGGHKYAGPGIYAVVVSISAPGGNGTTVRSAATVAPTLSVTASAIEAVQRSSFAGTVASFTTDAPDLTAARVAATVDWGDGVRTAGIVSRPGGPGSPFRVAGSHTYARSGAFTLVVTVAIPGRTAAADSRAAVAAQPPPAPRITGLRRAGYHWMPTTIVLSFSGPLDPARARDVGNYVLTGPAPSARAIPIVGAGYDPTANTVTLHPAHRLDVHPRFRYTLVVRGSAPGGLAGPTGVPLDGAGTGRPGGDYIVTFSGFGPPPTPSRSTVPPSQPLASAGTLAPHMIVPPFRL